MLTEAPIPLVRGVETRLDGPRDPVRVEPVGDHWRIWWQQPINGEPIGCLLLDDDVNEDHYLARYEASRGMSPFNDGLFTTRVLGDAKVTVAFGQRFEKRTGGVTSTPLVDGYAATLVDEFGYSEEIVAALPPDNPTPVPS